MSSSMMKFRAHLNVFQQCLSPEDLEIFGSATIDGVRTAVMTTQSRQETERTMMDMTRIQLFLDRTSELAHIFRMLPDSSRLMAVIWGSLKMIISTASQVPKALDTLLDAYEQLGHKMPDMENAEAKLKMYPDLWKVVELVYEELIGFQHFVFTCCKSPDMRILFRSTWNAYKSRFKATLSNIETYGTFFVHVRNSNTLQLFVQNTYEIEANGGNIHAGDNYMESAEARATRTNIRDQLAKLEQALGDAKQSLKQQEKERADERKVKVQGWVAGPDSYSHHKRACDVRLDYPQTGLWILENKNVSSWMNDDLPRNPILWVHGIPGAGKTVLASVIIDACERVEDSETAYYYCDYNSSELNTTISVLTSLLRQAIVWRPDLLPYFDDQRQNGGELTIQKQKTAERLCDLVCHGGPRTYLVIDGIDESAPSERRSTLMFLSALVQDIDRKVPGKLRLLVLSQNEPDIKRYLATASELEIQKNLNGDDIRLFVEKLTKEIGSKFNLSAVEVQTLQRRVCWYASAQFLYARLVLENLLASPTSQHFRNEVEDSHFPRELSDAYERIINRIKDNTSDAEWTVAQQLLGWMTCAARSLKWHEIQGALSIDFATGSVDFDEKSLRRHVRDICGALVSVHDDRINLVHQTAQMYIAQSKYIDIASVECQMANLCIHYLCFDCFDTENSSAYLRDLVLEGYYAFADYASAKWTHHLYRVVDQALELSDDQKWRLRHSHVIELFKTIDEFCLIYQEDLERSQDDAKSREVDTQISPETFTLLHRDLHGDAARCFQNLWTHAEASRTGDIYSRHLISLPKLRIAMDKIREVLETLSSDSILSEEQIHSLKTYYGDKLYRCPKASCYFFHQGFEDARTRRLHVDRHERPYYCSEPDCPAADFGFSDKKAFDAHTTEIHPDSEMKAKMFKTVLMKPKNTKYVCARCDKFFARNSILQAHQRSHDGQKPFECTRCNKAFTRKNDCIRHEKSVHDRIRAPSYVSNQPA